MLSRCSQSGFKRPGGWGTASQGVAAFCPGAPPAALGSEKKSSGEKNCPGPLFFAKLTAWMRRPDFDFLS